MRRERALTGLLAALSMAAGTAAGFSTRALYRTGCLLVAALTAGVVAYQPSSEELSRFAGWAFVRNPIVVALRSFSGPLSEDRFNLRRTDWAHNLIALLLLLLLAPRGLWLIGPP